MADTHETDRPPVTAAEAVRDLFAQPPAPGRDIVWLADQLVGIVQHLGSVSLERVRDAGVDVLVCRSEAAPFVPAGRDPLRLLRPLLARVAVLAADETGAELQPYGGRCSLVRSSRTGPVRIEIEFTNTPAAQRLTLTRVPTPTNPRTVPGTDAGVVANSPQPSA